MRFDEVMERLQALGTAQNVKTYRRHGAGENTFGVSFANLGKLQKAIKVDQGLAEQLWATGNGDAQLLACMIADPAAVEEALLDRWLAGCEYYCLVDVFSGNLASRAAGVRERAERWIDLPSDWFGQAGWNLVAHLALKDLTLPDEVFRRDLERIERELQHSPNRTRHAMNNALIAIGLRNGDLEQAALAAAGRIGKVVVDHGSTSCTTPDAAAYIARAKQRQPHVASRSA